MLARRSTYHMWCAILAFGGRLQMPRTEQAGRESGPPAASTIMMPHNPLLACIYEGSVPARTLLQPDQHPHGSLHIQVETHGTFGLHQDASRLDRPPQTPRQCPR